MAQQVWIQLGLAFGSMGVTVCVFVLGAILKELRSLNKKLGDISSIAAVHTSRIDTLEKDLDKLSDTLPCLLNIQCPRSIL